MADPATCEGHGRFTATSAIYRFLVQNETILLKHHPDVFPPSPFGLNFAERIDFTGCRRAADIGTGTGLLAILAAKKGVADIRATDTSHLALDLTRHNARALNAVAGIETSQGAFFCDLDGPFDVITANLPQEIIPPRYRDHLTELQAQAIDGGGAGGNQILLDFLEIAPCYMRAHSRLYVIVNTITDYRTTLRRIDAGFAATLVWEGSTQTKAFVRDHADFFRGLIESGIVSLTEDATGTWWARQFIYRLGLKT